MCGRKVEPVAHSWRARMIVLVRTDGPEATAVVVTREGKDDFAEQGGLFWNKGCSA